MVDPTKKVKGEKNGVRKRGEREKEVEKEKRDGLNLLDSMSVTLDTSQAAMSALNATLLRKRYDISVTKDVSHA